MLWLLRHAEAVDTERERASGRASDDDRPLTERGVRQAESAGRALAALDASIDVCLSSPKLRAVQTAQLACEPLGVGVTIEPRLSGSPFDHGELTAGLGNVMLVGHDPSFSLALHDLTGVQARMRKGGLAGIDKG